MARFVLRLRGMGKSAEPLIRVEAIEDWLRGRRGLAGARVTGMRPLGSDDQGIKAYGYGAPLHITYVHGGRTRELVLRTMSADPFGHDRRADRVAQMVLAADTFPAIPRHIQPLESGIIDPSGELVPSPQAGEPYLLTDYVEGRVYGRDLERLVHRHDAVELDVARARALATYLVELHARRGEPGDYLRAVRDLVGSGEGIFGLCDSYPESDPVATPERLRALETAAVRWRWKLRRYAHRARRVHGDFHPYNLLFRSLVAFSVLDASRGGVGDPADDVTCLSINYLFFGLLHDQAFRGPHRDLWDTFWHGYLSATGDDELLDVVAPWFAWRALVLASPVWYPGVDAAIRDTLLRFAERLLDGRPFSPDHIDGLIA